MRRYEIMFIVRPNLEDTNIKKIVSDFSQVLENNQAKIIEKKELGQKELAYEINNHKSGYYFLYQVEANDSKAIEEFDRLALINEDVLRHLIIKLEK